MSFGGQNIPESMEIAPDTDQKSFVTSVWGSIKNAIIGCSAAVIFGLVVLAMSILSVTNPQAVFPQTDYGPEATMSAQPTPSAEVEYYFPYPGVLPDSPLYKVKALRDQMRLWLTFDPIDKAERELLYADKRINAAVALVEGGKVDLGVSTATKAEKYMEQAVNRVLVQHKVGQDVTSMLLTLQTATTAHIQMLHELQSKTSGENQLALQQSLNLSQLLQEKISQALLE